MIGLAAFPLSNLNTVHLLSSTENLSSCTRAERLQRGISDAVVDAGACCQTAWAESGGELRLSESGMDETCGWLPSLFPLYPGLSLR